MIENSLYWLFCYFFYNDYFALTPERNIFNVSFKLLISYVNVNKQLKS